MDTEQTLGQRLCQALGLNPDDVRRITVSVRAHCPDEIAEATVLMLVRDGEAVAEVMKHYQLTLKD